MAQTKAAKARMARFTELTKQMKADPDVLLIVNNWCARVGLSNVGAMAERRPGEFDKMCKAIDSLLEQAPQEHVPRWMQ